LLFKWLQRNASLIKIILFDGLKLLLCFPLHFVVQNNFLQRIYGFLNFLNIVMLYIVDLERFVRVYGEVVLMLKLKISFNQAEKLTIRYLSLKEIVSLPLNLTLITVFCFKIGKWVSYLKIF
jgi:hypothetical protein